MAAFYEVIILVSLSKTAAIIKKRTLAPIEETGVLQNG
jgi:hypothetical protein